METEKGGIKDNTSKNECCPRINAALDLENLTNPVPYLNDIKAVKSKLSQLQLATIKNINSPYFLNILAKFYCA